MIAAVIAIAVMIAVLLFVWLRKPVVTQGPSWSAGPVIDGYDYSSPIVIDATGSFDFPQGPPGVHYVTKPSGSLAGAKGIRMSYRIDGTAQFRSANDGTPINEGPVIYFERKGDNWRGTGPYETYRWWATAHVDPLTPGDHTITALFTDRWTAVETSNSQDHASEFQAALADAGLVGFTFPSDTGQGHGCFATGPCRFTLVSFEII